MKYFHCITPHSKYFLLQFLRDLRENVLGSDHCTCKHYVDFYRGFRTNDLEH